MVLKGIGRRGKNGNFWERMKGKFKNSFKKEEKSSKKIKKDKEELLRDLHKLLTILYKQIFIRPYCQNNEYRVVIDNNSRIMFCRILGNINAMYRLAHREYNKVSAETRQLDRELYRLNKEYYEALQQGRRDAIKRLEEMKLRIIKDLKVEQEEKTLFLNIISLHRDNEHLVKQLMGRIKNKAIKKDLRQLDKLIKKERKIINKLNKHIKEENKLFKEEIKSIKKLYDVIQY